MQKLLMVTLLVAISFGLMSQKASAGYIVQGAKIVRISNSAHDVDLFTVMTTGGTGPCAADGVRIYFYRTATAPKTLDYAIALAISAMNTGATVDIFNYSSDACEGATFIDVYK